MQRIPWLFFFLFFCHWWRDFFFFFACERCFAAVGGRFHVLQSQSRRSLTIRTAAFKDWRPPLMKRQQNEAMRAGTRRFIRKSMVRARLRWRRYIVLIFLWAQGHSQLRQISPSNYRSGLFFPPPSFTASVNRFFFFLFKSDNLALRRTVKSTLCILRATLNSHLSTTCLFRAVFWYISQISTLFLPTVERRSRCCAWDSSTKQRNIHHRRRSSHLSLDCDWCGGGEKGDVAVKNSIH